MSRPFSGKDAIFDYLNDTTENRKARPRGWIVSRRSVLIAVILCFLVGFINGVGFLYVFYPSEKPDMVPVIADNGRLDRELENAIDLQTIHMLRKYEDDIVTSGIPLDKDFALAILRLVDRRSVERYPKATQKFLEQCRLIVVAPGKE